MKSWKDCTSDAEDCIVDAVPFTHQALDELLPRQAQAPSRRIVQLIHQLTGGVPGYIEHCISAIMSKSTVIKDLLFADRLIRSLVAALILIKF